jgi:putative transposase
MIRIHLDDTTRSKLNTLRRSDLPAAARDRIEMIFLSDAGWSPPRIAAHLGYHPQAIRDRLRDFLGRGPDALFPGRPGPAPDIGRRGEVARALTELLGEGRTWTSRQLAAAPAGRGIALGPRQVRRHLKRLKAGYRRTTNTLKHKQDPAEAGRALDNLRRKAAAGRLKLYFLDECGFAPTLPTA